MTAAVADRPARTPNRTLTVVRMQLINRQTFLWLPLIILLSSFAISLAIYGIIAYTVGDDGRDPIYGGGSQAPLWYFAAVGVQALTLSFPFSQAVSATRREFYLGTLLTAALSALGLSLIYLIGGLIEKATDGWGFDGYFFYLPWIWDQGPAVATLLFFVVSMFAFMLGFWAATIYKRFGMLGVILTIVGILLALVVAAVAITGSRTWAGVGRWLAGVEPLTVCGIVVLVAVVLGGASYLTLRRTSP